MYDLVKPNIGLIKPIIEYSETQNKFCSPVTENDNKSYR